jgi:spore coat polysaccharide biosynthesis protein SpsF
LNITAIIQARLGSTRLPGKLLRNICGKPLLQHVIERVQAAKTITHIVVATTSNSGDAPLVEFLRHLPVGLFIGSEDDVLDRFYQAASQDRSDIIVRITPDDPFKDPEIIDQAVMLLTRNTLNALDYVSNTSSDGSIRPTYPEGLDIEVMTFSCLEHLWKEARKPSEREHVTPYLFSHRDKFHIQSFSNPTDLSHLRWTIDYEKDFLFAQEIYNRLYSVKPIFVMRDILQLLEKEPALCRINSGIMRNEGYHRSVLKDLGTP